MNLTKNFFKIIISLILLISVIFTFNYSNAKYFYSTTFPLFNINIDRIKPVANIQSIPTPQNIYLNNPNISNIHTISLEIIEDNLITNNLNIDSLIFSQGISLTNPIILEFNQISDKLYNASFSIDTFDSSSICEISIQENILVDINGNYNDLTLYTLNIDQNPVSNTFMTITRSLHSENISTFYSPLLSHQ